MHIVNCTHGCASEEAGLNHKHSSETSLCFICIINRALLKQHRVETKVGHIKEYAKRKRINIIVCKTKTNADKHNSKGQTGPEAKQLKWV